MASAGQTSIESSDRRFLEAVIRLTIGVKMRIHRCQGCDTGQCATDFEPFFRDVIDSVELWYEINEIRMCRPNQEDIPLLSIEPILKEVADVHKSRFRSLYCCK